MALIIFFTTLGLALTGHEAYEIATEEPCTEVRAIISSTRSLNFSCAALAIVSHGLRKGLRRKQGLRRMIDPVIQFQPFVGQPAHRLSI